MYHNIIAWKLVIIKCIIVSKPDYPLLFQIIAAIIAKFDGSETENFKC